MAGSYIEAGTLLSDFLARSSLSEHLAGLHQPERARANEDTGNDFAQHRRETDAFGQFSGHLRRHQKNENVEKYAPGVHRTGEDKPANRQPRARTVTIALVPMCRRSPTSIESTRRADRSLSPDRSASSARLSTRPTPDSSAPNVNGR